MSDTQQTEKHAYQAALRLLATRDYCRHKLTNKLLERGHLIDDIFLAFEQLTQEGLFKEENYASARIRGLLRKGHGMTSILHKLRLEKVELSESKIRELIHENGFDEKSIIKSLLLKRIGHQTEQLEEEKVRHKQIRFLLSKGHSLQVINCVIRELQSF